MKSLARVAGLAALLLSVSAQAQITGAAGSTAAPPTMVGGFAMTVFGDDARAGGSNVSSVASPLGGDLTFNVSLNLRSIGDGWATWSHGYTGDVYYTPGASVTLTLPAETSAFYLYVQPDDFSERSFRVASGSLVFNETITGKAGAERFEFAATGGGFLSTITIQQTDWDFVFGGFAIGEFGIARGQPGGGGSEAIPEPATVGLLGGGLLLLLAWRRVRSRQRGT